MRSVAKIPVALSAPKMLNLGSRMKLIKSLALTVLVVTATLCVSASTVRAALINITIDPNTGLPATDVSLGTIDDHNVPGLFNFAGTDVTMFNTFSGSNLPAPVFAGFASYVGNPGSVDITGFDYAVLHYRQGRDGISQGGGVEIFYLNGMTGNFTFSEFGLGPNGRGRISCMALFAGSPSGVPDGGSTVALLGMSLSGLAFARRFLKR